MTIPNEIKAEVIAVFPDKVKISVQDIAAFSDGKSIKVGSYLRISDSEDCALIAIIENFCIEVTEKAERRHVIEALPLGIIRDGKFIRGGDTLTIPPTGVSPASEADIKKKSLRIQLSHPSGSRSAHLCRILRSMSRSMEIDSSINTLQWLGPLVPGSLTPLPRSSRPPLRQRMETIR